MRTVMAALVTAMTLLLPDTANAQRQCKRGIPCGGSCISASRSCRVGSSSGSSESASSTLPIPAAASPPRIDSAATLNRTPNRRRSSARVSVDTVTRVYYCPGTPDYGEAIRGEYANERDALAAGNRPAYGTGCGETIPKSAAESNGLLAVFDNAGASETTLTADGGVRVRLSMKSRVYYCPSSAEYAASQRGAFMHERDAKLAGFVSSSGVLCTTGEVAPNTPPSTMLRLDTAEPPRASASIVRNTKVWVNTKSRAYHCPGTRYYGTTADGSYMTEQQAITNGFRGAGGRACGS